MSTRLFAVSLAVVGLTCFGGSPVGSDQPEFSGSAGTYTQLLDCEQKPKAFAPFAVGMLIDPAPVSGGEQSIRCVTRASNNGVGRKGVKVTLEGEIVDLDGNSLVTLPAKTDKTDRNGYAVQEYDLTGLTLPGEVLAAALGGSVSGGKKKSFNSLESSCQFRNRRPCQPGNETLCLLDENRFKVEVEWRSASGSGPGRVVMQPSARMGYFGLDNPNAEQLLVELLSGCSNNDHFWVFAQALTSIEFEITVTDTATGASRTYDNDLGQAFQPITDTSAFATCP